jgi:hypothetical protein
VGFNGAIWWLPRTVHRYSQLQPQCQCLDAHILSECDVPDFGDECRRRGRKRRLLPIRLGSTGSSVRSCFAPFAMNTDLACSALISKSYPRTALPPIRSLCVSIFDTLVSCLTPGTQIAPTLHPPLNITSTTASPMNWTVSLVCNRLFSPAQQTCLKRQ